MQNQYGSTALQNSDEPSASEGELVSSALHEPSGLETLAQQKQELEYARLRQRRKLIARLRLLFLGLLVLLILGWVLIAFIHKKGTTKTLVSDFGIIHLPLDNIPAPRSSIDVPGSLKVQGQLQVTGSLVLTPISQPLRPVRGQLFYDQTSNYLAYYNGQQFINISGTPASVTNVTNTLGGNGFLNAPSSVLLQSSSPGLQQSGNFNISGTGTVGKLKTSVIDSSGAALYINPLTESIITTTSAAGASATLGLTSIGAASTADTGSVNGVILATKATMGSTGGSLNSITVYLAGGSSAKHIQVALYDDDGDVPSRPSALLGTSAIVNLTPNAFNTVPIPSIALTPNASYWLAFNTDDPTVARTYNGGSKTSCFYGLSFSFMPDPFGPGPCFFADQIYGIYANYTTVASSNSSFSKAHLAFSDTGQAVFQNSSDSTTAFQVQNAASTTVLNIDTINDRVAIGKATAAYKLDIAGGDINLSNNRSIRFGGSQALTVNAAGTTTSVSNFSPGGKVIAQADSFIVQDANGLHPNVVIGSSGEATFSNRINSTTAFQIQNAAGTSLFRVNTTGSQIFIGNPAGDANPVILYLANKNTADDPPGAEGGVYYNSTLASFRCFYSGFWQNCADIEPQHGFSLYDEFVSSQTSFSGTIGSLGWNAVAIGAHGSITLNPATPPPSANRPGVIELQTPATINQGTTLLLGNASGNSMIIAKDNDVKTAVAVGSASGQVLRIGLHNQAGTTAQPISGVWWEADASVSPNWRYCYGDGVTATCSNSTVAITANSWATLEIRVTATGSGSSAATFVINNSPFSVNASSTINTTSSVAPALSCYSTSGGAQDCYWDYFQLTGITSAAR